MLTESLIRDIMDELPMDTLDATIMHGKSIADYLVMLKFAESKSMVEERNVKHRSGEAIDPRRRCSP